MSRKASNGTSGGEKTPALSSGRRGRGWLYALGGLTAAVALGAAAVIPLFRPASTNHRTIRVVVPNGANVTRIGQALEQNDVIRSAWAFGWYVRRRGGGDRFKAGRYALSPDMTLAQIVQELQQRGAKANDEQVRVTIPEGYTLRQIAKALEEKGATDGAQFLKLATSPAAIAQMHADFPLPKATLEGYLFPDTYFFSPKTPPMQVIDTMLLNFSQRFARPYLGEIERNGRDLHQLVTEASLIEREAKVPADRPRIAGVLDNRLERGMRLEVDATVLYALGHHKNRVLYKDLEVSSPYNTYRHKGLPPGPIASPGLSSLLAALRPEKNPYIYYVARPDGSHLFTRTPQEHEAAKRQARAERRQQQNGSEEMSGG